MAQGKDRSYYNQGSEQPSVATSLTVRKLEQRRQLTRTSQRLVIVLVGLPGRGKSFIGRKLHRFLTWRGENCRVFNVGKYRREATKEVFIQTHPYSNQERAAPVVEAPAAHQREEAGACSANFFDNSNEEAARLREQVARFALEDMLSWLCKDYSSDDDLPSVSECESSSNGPSVTEGGSNGGAGAQRRSRRHQNRVAIFDATNSTKSRRNLILEACSTYQAQNGGKPIGVVFVESICSDKELLEENYRYKISTSPDFKGLSQEEALADLRLRALKYEERYETLDDDSQSYIKIYNLSTKLMTNQIYGRMSKVIVPALMAWNIGDRPIFLCRSGKTIDGDNNRPTSFCMNSERVSSDSLIEDMERAHSNLSLNSLAISVTSEASNNGGQKKRGRSASERLGNRGMNFRDALRDYVTDEGMSFMNRRHYAVKGLKTGTSVTGTATLVTGVRSTHSYDVAEEREENKKECSDAVPFPAFPCHVMTSTMPRAIQSATWEKLPFEVNQYSNLNPLDKGDFSGMELDEIKERFPEWYADLERDPFRTRFPGGECYQDLVNRLESTIIDMEQQVAPVVVVSHVSVLQCLLAYFRASPVEECTKIEVPMHTVIKLVPLRGGGWNETRHNLIPCDPMDCCSNSSGSDGERDVNPPIWGDSVGVNTTS